MSCPVEETCPIIDKVVESFNRIIVEAIEQIEHGEGDTTKILQEIISEAEDSIKILDDIRIANAAIREWGEDREDIALAKIRLLELMEK